MRPIEALALASVLLVVAGAAIFLLAGRVLARRQSRRELEVAESYASQYDVRRRPYETDYELARRIVRVVARRRGLA